MEIKGNINAGYGNTITGSTKSSILGGASNTVTSSHSSIIGGSNNNVFSTKSFIGGGSENIITGGTYGYSSIVGGGYVGTGNQIFDSNWGFIGGGSDNKIHSSNYSNVIGGYGNIVDNASYVSNIVGGAYNTIDNGSIRASIVGGNNNTINLGKRAFIGGGNTNYIGLGRTVGSPPVNDSTPQFATIVGGFTNVIVSGGSQMSFIGGGFNNTMDDSIESSIVGGNLNEISGSTQAFIGGGLLNTINTGNRSSIVGGRSNVMEFLRSTIAGGYRNKMLNTTTNIARNSFIGGGSNNYITSTSFNDSQNFIGAGQNNLVNISENSSVVGGGYNTVEAPYCVIAGGYKNNISTSVSTVAAGAPPSKGPVATGSAALVIAGGYKNGIYSTSQYSSLLGGFNNIVFSGSPYATIGGGWGHRVIETRAAFIGGGGGNKFYGRSDYSSIVGGYGNHISGTTTSNNSRYSVIGGGTTNRILDDSDSAFIGSGKGNVIINSDYSSIIGGQSNTVNHANAHIIGSSITSVSANTTHVEKLNVSTLNGTTAVSSLAIDANGMVVSGNSLNTGAFIHTATGTISPTNVYSNSNGSNYTSVLGGYGNSATTFSLSSVIGGGKNNEINGLFGLTSWSSSILGGYGNIVSQSSTSAIVGGASNVITSTNYSSINGGFGNAISSTSNYSTIGGGYSNTISGSSKSFIGGGQSNINQSKYSFIGGGKSNQIQDSTTNSKYNNIVGGGSNIIEANDKPYNTNGDPRQTQGLQILGGYGNVINGPTSMDSIIGGYFNKISGATAQSLIGSGWYNYINVATEGAAVGGLHPQNQNLIIGGKNNSVDVISPWGETGADLGGHSIIGGNNNRIYSTTGGTNWNKQDVIVGGVDNTIQNSDFSIIGAGTGNTINGANNSSIIGGSGNTLTHNHSHILGSNITSVLAHTTHVENLYVDSTTSNDPLFVNTSGDTVVINSSGNVGIGTATPAGALEVVGVTLLEGNTSTRALGIADQALPVGGLPATSAHAQIFHNVSTSRTTGLLVNHQSAAASSPFGSNTIGIDIQQNKSNSGNTNTALKLDVSAGLTNIALQTQRGTIIFNESADADSDVRMEGDTEVNLFYLDASANSIGLGTATPTDTLHVNGVTGSTQFRLEQSFTPTGSGDTVGNIGSVAWDDSYLYTKTNTGWGRSAWDYAF